MILAQPLISSPTETCIHLLICADFEDNEDTGAFSDADDDVKNDDLDVDCR